MYSIWGTLKELFGVMPKGAGKFYVFYSVVSGLLAILDVLALALVVLVVSSLSTSSKIKLPVIGEIPESNTFWVLLLICLLFILKSFLSMSLFWWATNRFARYELEVGNQLFLNYVHSSWENRSRLSTAEVTRIVDSSMAIANAGFILQLTQIPGLFITFLAVFTVLIISQPLTAVLAIVYLSIVFSLLFLAVFRRTKRAGNQNRDLTFRVATLITEMVESLKELTLREKLLEVGSIINEKRTLATKSRSLISFASTVPKYAFEAALIGGFLLIGSVSFIIGGASEAILSITLFAATGFRMIPALYGIQTSLASATAYEVHARDVINELRSASSIEQNVFQIPDENRLPTQPRNLILNEVSFRYPGTEHDVLEKVSLKVPLGSSLAVVGPSGSGKSTLIDILLGLSLPTIGEILIDHTPVSSVISQWRKRVGYVPQRVSIFNGSIAQNVALTWREDFDIEKVQHALNKSHLGELISRNKGIFELVGERGDFLSGGQQQRLGIARALYTNPLVLVMDEATSSLDTETENRVVESMRELRGEVTFITVAHRLATIREYDQVCYMEKGRVIGLGTFDQVVKSVPNFANQARLAGLI